MLKIASRGKGMLIWKDSLTGSRWSLPTFKLVSIGYLFFVRHRISKIDHSHQRCVDKDALLTDFGLLHSDVLLRRVGVIIVSVMSVSILVTMLPGQLPLHHVACVSRICLC